MSGPKVVRIVTREEILAICEGHLHRLAQAFERWRAQAERIGELDAAELAATGARHERLRRMLQDDQLTALQNEVPAEIEFLSRDLAQREERAVGKAAQARKSQRNLRENAASLLRSLEAGSSSPDPSLVEALQSIASGRAIVDAQAIVAEGFARLGHDTRSESLSDIQRDLARKLQVERSGRWVAEEHTSREPRLDHIDHHIAQLQTLHGASAADSFLRRLEIIERDPHAAQRNMLLDSLVLDLASATAEHQTRRSRLASLGTLASELETLLGQAGSALPAQVAAYLAEPEPDMQQVDAFMQQCTDAIQHELHRRAAFARRRAVLDGLASLGYEVREGMETAWAAAGSVVLRKMATPGYGVEVGGRAESGRLQVRAVSLSGTHDRARDRDIETIWCGEFTRLRSLIAERGGELTIEKALAIGEVPLKVVEVKQDGNSEASEFSTKSSS
ncbi:hypothetical protein [Novilysobacter spongiicola]|uniref:Uncharacterized protein n=1 Tax=Lysobacter spongiicola DSM 21749 TaxID=1122188 RepID=A0A1T4SJN1_9GAMM|nr:hypothetical protein [Lysobacter spongiicola]SKA28412.1 hypothetical protein SAMN02745674_02917 [Lysobacter spongiicola DSM 21749]